MNKPIKAGITIGSITLLLGVIVFLFGSSISSELIVVKKIVFASPALIIMGIAFLFFPGGNNTIHQLKTKRDLWKYAPSNHKIIWVSAMVTGWVLSILLIQ